MTAPGAAGPGRARLAAAAAVVLLALAALLYGLRADAEQAAPAPDEDPTATIDQTDARGGELAGLQARAALDPCPPGLGPELPDLELACLGGGAPVDLRSAPPGRPTVVNLWASWCGPCREEVPALAEFREAAGDRVGVVGVLTTDTRRAALTFAEQFGMRWPSVVDDDGLVRRAFAGGVPVTLFLRADGSVAHVLRGPFADRAELEALVAEHLGVVL
ncbi:MAG TPA: TlpA disulfide reductase family protein [Mycobacteriales bacterium]|nr:TlpA disulfide reductase family protein [Mycobacteriales bacterium]